MKKANKSPVEVRPYLENTAFKFKDISEQPDSKYVMILQGQAAVPQIAVAVDIVDVKDGVVYAYRDGNARAIAAFAQGFVEFGMFDRSLFHEVTRDSAMRRAHMDMESLKALRREIDPEGAQDEEMIHEIERNRLREMHGTALPTAKVPGQYV